MTREAKIAELINIRDNFNYALTPREVFDDAIKALKQEPCEDAVSRKAVFGLVKQMYLEVANSTVDSHTISDCISLTASKCREYIDEHIRELPSVTPTSKKGKWIGHVSNMNCEDIDNFYDEDWDGTTHECSLCHATYFYMTDFCPNCGADMEGEE